MKTVNSLSCRCLLAILLVAAAGFTPKASADLLTNTWFKLTLSAKGRTLATNDNVTVKPLNITRTVYMNISTNIGNPHVYQVKLWTKVDGVWSNIVNTPRAFVGQNDSFISDFGLTFRTSSNATFNTFHTAFLNNKTNSDGRLRSTSYSGSGEVFNGNLDGKRYFGSLSIIGPQTSPSRLPFTP